MITIFDKIILSPLKIKISSFKELGIIQEIRFRQKFFDNLPNRQNSNLTKKNYYLSNLIKINIFSIYFVKLEFRQSGILSNWNVFLDLPNWIVILECLFGLSKNFVYLEDCQKNFCQIGHILTIQY